MSTAAGTSAAHSPDPQSRTLSHDPDWPRTGGWPAPDAAAQTEDEANPSQRFDLALIGVPTSRTSLSPSNAHLTPAAVREALRRYSGHVVAAASQGARAAEAEMVIDEVLRIVDAGDVSDPDTEAGEAAATARITELARQCALVVALGGDNALTVPVALGVAGAATDTATNDPAATNPATNNPAVLGNAGLITVDAHHDLRNGRSNGSPVRRLVEAGVDPRRIVQIGIADFANSRAYRQRARDWGITVIHRDELHDRPLRSIVAEALEVAGAAGGPIHVDLDVDVCDRSVAPGCPASIPGGIQAHELRTMTRLFASDQRVRGIDIAEVDATADAPDGRTVRLAALLVLEAATGLAQRLGR